ncbi:MAG: hypothetical protein HFG31_00620 [Eubacterium sp.]|nr:hypothetical protein [Eubacterium sp.]
MKIKIFSFMLLLFICTAATFTIKADTQPITTNKSIKVNKNTKLYKILKVKKSTMKNYTITSSKPKVASVSSTGVVKGLKKGSSTIELLSKSTGTAFAKVKIKVKNKYNKAELRLMSSIIFSEAGSECFAGKKAVGIVIMNRIKSKSFPGSLSGVIYQPYQFGPVRNGSLSRSLSLYDSGRLNKDCIKAAKLTLNGDKKVKYRNKTIDMSSYLFFSGYVSGARLSIQNHQFK